MKQRITAEDMLRKQPEPMTDLAKYLDDTAAQQPNLHAVVDSDGSTLATESFPLRQTE